MLKDSFKTILAKARERLYPKDHWGIISGTTIAIVALFAPWFLLELFFDFILIPLSISNNIKNSISTILAYSLSLGAVAISLKIYGKKFKDIGFDKPRPDYFFKALMFFGVYFVMSLCLQLIATSFFGMDASQDQNVGYTSPSGFELILAFISLVGITPITEEVLFRGILFTGYRRRMSFAAAAIASSAIFGLMHGQWNVGLDVFAMGVVSCYLLEKTKSIWPSIFLHVIKNSVAFYLLYLYNGG